MPMRIRPHRFRILFIYFLIGAFTAVLCMVFFRPSPGVALNRLSNLLFTTMSATAKKPVIVIGSGLAGLSAAHEALREGASVRLLDRAPKPGGNSIKASSGINGAGTRFQQALNIPTDESFYSDTVRSAGSKFTENNPPGIDREALVKILTGQSENAVSWLADELNVDLSVVAQLGGHSVPRTHRGGGELPPGAAIISALLSKIKANPAFTLENSAEVDKLLVDDSGAVKGVGYRTSDGKTHELEGPVIFAAGGFAGDAQGLLAKYRPDLAGMPSTNEERPASHGLLSTIGAALVDMDSVQIHPTGFVFPKGAGNSYKVVPFKRENSSHEPADAKPAGTSQLFLAAEALRGEGGILLSGNGERFVNELDTRDVVSNAIMALPQSTDKSMRYWEVILLLDPGACEATASHIKFYLWKGLVQKVKVKDLAPEIIASIDKYATTVSEHGEDPFGRKSFGHWKLPPGEANREEEVCVGTVTPVVHFTMGGVAFDTKARVLRSTDGGKLTPIPGIWAAGEITGGIHGANRLGGSSLLECAVFGRIAGTEAARSLIIS
ncbi:Flavocytochrome c [Daldinia caldariorum]|uniref:Flavocytochrome c n=1 Tax=Daldinia caldariorum TaxID=326644 RepID=UPI002008E1A2|nr:Flavocytochrome c [Daldinia caldariorum]KAI1466272.1 Flavocytochrome c [Daldinia caldariorum]